MTLEFRHLRSRAVAASGSPNHRGRDLIVAEGTAQVIEAKIAYGPIDKDLKDEDVVFERETLTGWEPLATVRTSHDSPDDDGGRARYEVPSERAFGLGRHRVRATVLGDKTEAELAVVVVPEKHPIFVSDIDGTITVSEVAEFPAMARGELPDPHPYAAAVFHRLAQRGLVPVYLTARPEWLLPRTRAFLALHGFPPGIVVTRRDKSGGFGASAAAGKLVELERLAASFDIAWAFGNMPSDAHAYSKIVPDARRRVLYRFHDEAHGARRIDSYEELLGEIGEI
jgi:phosphatidate phosphatase APP1